VPEAQSQWRREQPTLYIAVGGMGIQALCRLRALTAPRDPEEPWNEAAAAIALDTDRDDLREACSNRWKLPLTPDDTLHLPLRLPKSYDNSREILGWVSRRWLYNIPRSLETRGYRPLGRVALVDNLPRVVALVEKKLERLAGLLGAADAAGEERDRTLRIVLLAGTGGGTGAGTVMDLAYAAKSLATARDLPIEIHGFLICSWLASNSASPLVAANSYALLTELSHATLGGNVGSVESGKQATRLESPEAPFDSVYLVPTRARTPSGQAADGVDAIAKYLALEMTPDARTVIRTCRGSQTPREQAQGRSLAIKTLGVASLADERRELTNQLAIELADTVKRQWVAPDTKANWEQLWRDEKQAANKASLDAAEDEKPGPAPTTGQESDMTPLALRSRFKEHMSLNFASDVVRHVTRRLEARDDRGQPLMQPRDAKQLTEAARLVAGSLVSRADRQSPGTDRFSDSPVLRPLIAAASDRIIRRAVEVFDVKQAERFLPPDSLDEHLKCACQELLEECLRKPDFAKALSAGVDMDGAIARTIQRATPDLLQCGCDRRTLLFVPAADVHDATVEKMLSARPLATVVPTDIDEPLVVTEAAGISPRSLALGFERVFPGIADAGRRLLTRVDIEWRSLER
jgi:hypothetical protein